MIIKGLKKRLESDFHAKCEIKDRVVFVSVKKADYLHIARYLKASGFKRLLTVSAVDWLADKKIEVYFIAYNAKEGAYIKVSAKVQRKNPGIKSLGSVWPNSAMHEREAWEMFRINFEGNDILKPLFLEDWKGPPPFRKDFDWRAYVKKQL